VCRFIVGPTARAGQFNRLRLLVLPIVIRRYRIVRRPAAFHNTEITMTQAVSTSISRRGMAGLALTAASVVALATADSAHAT